MPPRNIPGTFEYPVPFLCGGMRQDLGLEELGPADAYSLTNYDIDEGCLTPRPGFARYLTIMPDGEPVLFLDYVRVGTVRWLIASTRDHVYYYDGGWVDITPSYAVGTVTTVNGNATVTGALTLWTAENVLIGVPINDTFLDLNGVPYTITGLNVGAQTITIDPVYAGAGGAGEAYQVVQKLYTTGKLPAMEDPRDTLPSPGSYMGQTYYWAPRGMCEAGIAVKRNKLLKWSGNPADVSLALSLSPNAGASYSTEKYLASSSSDDVVSSVGSASDLWNRAWAVAEFTDANFRVKLRKLGAAGSIFLDQLRAKIYYLIAGTEGNTGALYPSAYTELVSTHKWYNPSGAYALGGGYATSSSGYFLDAIGAWHGLNLMAGIPVGEPINGIKVEVYSKTPSEYRRKIYIDVSWDGGVTWTSTGYYVTTGMFGYQWDEVGGATSLWGWLWTRAEFADAFFRVRLHAENLGKEINVDTLRVTVYYGTAAQHLDTDWHVPTATGAGVNDWTTPANAYASDDAYASEATQDEEQDYHTFVLAVPACDGIEGIELSLEHHRTSLSGRMVEVALPAAFGHVISVGTLANHLFVGGLYDDILDITQLRQLSCSDEGDDTIWVAGDAQTFWLMDSFGQIVDIVRAEQLGLLVFKEDQLVFCTWVGPPLWVMAEVIPWESGGWSPAKLAEGFLFQAKQLGLVGYQGRSVLEMGQRLEDWRAVRGFSFLAAERLPPRIEEWRSTAALPLIREAGVVDVRRGLTSWLYSLATGFISGGSGEILCSVREPDSDALIYGGSDGYLYRKTSATGTDDDATTHGFASSYIGPWLDCDILSPKEIAGLRFQVTRVDPTFSLLVTIEVSEDMDNVGDSSTHVVTLDSTRPKLALGTALVGYYVRVKIDDAGAQPGYRVKGYSVLGKPRAI